MLITVTASVASAVLIAVAVRGERETQPTTDTIGILFLVAAQLALIALMAMAVIVSTSEYRFGQIRMTLAATPHRWLVLLCKALVTMVVAFAAGAVTAWVCVVAAKPLLPAAWRLELSDPDAMRIVWGLPLFFAAAALLAMSFGAILRNSPAAITILALLSQRRRPDHPAGRRRPQALAVGRLRGVLRVRGGGLPGGRDHGRVAGRLGSVPRLLVDAVSSCAGSAA